MSLPGNEQKEVSGISAGWGGGGICSRRDFAKETKQSPDIYASIYWSHRLAKAVLEQLFLVYSTASTRDKSWAFTPK